VLVGKDKSRFGLGTAPLGNLFEPVGDDDARDTVARAWELGTRYFDTAPLYGSGLAEQRLGSALADRPREELTIATKVGRLLRADAPPNVELDRLFKDTPAVDPVFDFSYDGVMRSFEESLVRLGVDRIDVLHIHDPDDHFEQALAGAFPALDRLRGEGVIGAVGVGMNQVEMLLRWAHEADFDCFLLAGRYSLLDHAKAGQLLSACEQRGIDLVVGGVYNSGILAGPGPNATFDYLPAAPELIERARRLDNVCGRWDVPLKAAAIQFPLGHPAVAKVLIGSRSPAEIEENVQMFETPIPAGLWEELRAEGLLSAEVMTPQPEV
jgi:D-threo-aldose 1-dehydrogenase